MKNNHKAHTSLVKNYPRKTAVAIFIVLIAVIAAVSITFNYLNNTNGPDVDKKVRKEAVTNMYQYASSLKKSTIEAMKKGINGKALIDSYQYSGTTQLYNGTPLSKSTVRWDGVLVGNGVGTGSFGTEVRARIYSCVEFIVNSDFNSVAIRPYDCAKIKLQSPDGSDPRTGHANFEKFDDANFAKISSGK